MNTFVMFVFWLENTLFYFLNHNNFEVFFTSVEILYKMTSDLQKNCLAPIQFLVLAKFLPGHKKSLNSLKSKIHSLIAEIFEKLQIYFFLLYLIFVSKDATSQKRKI